MSEKTEKVDKVKKRHIDKSTIRTARNALRKQLKYKVKDVKFSIVEQDLYIEILKTSVVLSDLVKFCEGNLKDINCIMYHGVPFQIKVSNEPSVLDDLFESDYETNFVLDITKNITIWKDGDEFGYKFPKPKTMVDIEAFDIEHVLIANDYSLEFNKNDAFYNLKLFLWYYPKYWAAIEKYMTSYNKAKQGET